MILSLCIERSRLEVFEAFQSFPISSLFAMKLALESHMANIFSLVIIFDRGKPCFYRKHKRSNIDTHQPLPGLPSYNASETKLKKQTNRQAKHQISITLEPATKKGDSTPHHQTLRTKKQSLGKTICP
jgi:hypothetical protein